MTCSSSATHTETACGQALSAAIIAHRGASADAPENTLPAFALAWKQEADAIELDVHLTRDGRLVVIHDHDTLRVTGQKLVVEESTLAELQALDAGEWKGAVWSGTRLPELCQVLAALPGGKRIVIELKGGPELAPAVRAALLASRVPLPQADVIGFNVETMAAASQCLPECRCYLLAGNWRGPDGRQVFDLARLLQAVADAHLAGLDLEYRTVLGNPDCVAAVRAAGLGLYVWTVDDVAAARQLVDLGVSGLTTNAPARIRAGLIS